MPAHDDTTDQNGARMAHTLVPLVAVVHPPSRLDRGRTSLQFANALSHQEASPSDLNAQGGLLLALEAPSGQPAAHGVLRPPLRRFSFLEAPAGGGAPDASLDVQHRGVRRGESADRRPHLHVHLEHPHQRQAVPEPPPPDGAAQGRLGAEDSNQPPAQLALSQEDARQVLQPLRSRLPALQQSAGMVPTIQTGNPQCAILGLLVLHARHLARGGAGALFVQELHRTHLPPVVPVVGRPLDGPHGAQAALPVPARREAAPPGLDDSDRLVPSLQSGSFAPASEGALNHSGSCIPNGANLEALSITSHVAGHPAEPSEGYAPNGPGLPSTPNPLQRNCQPAHLLHPALAAANADIVLDALGRSESHLHHQDRGEAPATGLDLAQRMHPPHVGNVLLIVHPPMGLQARCEDVPAGHDTAPDKPTAGRRLQQTTGSAHLASPPLGQDNPRTALELNHEISAFAEDLDDTAARLDEAHLDPECGVALGLPAPPREEHAARRLDAHSRHAPAHVAPDAEMLPPLRLYASGGHGLICKCIEDAPPTRMANQEEPHSLLQASHGCLLQSHPLCSGHPAHVALDNYRCRRPPRPPTGCP
mmetsp:Transcript_50182/g.162446  ORF Transcript_50182/g.162446 Transcript_50182/m.162446 type:complete len:591 (-) Transcript_50182:5021-6793(-)